MTVFRTLILSLLLALTLGVAQAQTIDVNSADAEQLTTLEGIGSVKAQAIVDERKAHGPFKSAEDLMSRVSGIGPKTIEHNQGHMDFGS